MRKLRLATAVVLLSLTPSQTAARPSSGTTNPQISYVRASTSGARQLIVANEDGSGAKTIYSSTRMLSGALAPDGMIYFWDGGNFMRMPATGGTAQRLFDTPGTIIRKSDLSNNGASLAWFSDGAGILFRYDIATGQQTPVVQVPFVIDLTFDHTGNYIIYAEQVGEVDYELKSVPAAGGSPTSLGLVAPISNFDSARADGTLVLTINVRGVGPHLALWKPGMSAPVRLVDGYNGTYRCDDSAILFDRMTPSGAALYRRASSGAITTVAKPESIFPSYKPVC